MPIRDFRTISVWLKIALIMLSLGVLLFVIGFATVSWMTASSSNYTAVRRGLWKHQHCPYRGHCQTGKYPSATLEDFHKATQAMECIGLICQLMAFLILLLYLFVDSCRRREALLAVIFFCFGGVLCMVIGFIVFSVEYEERGYEVGWSQGVAMGGCICTFIAGVMCVLQHSAK